MGCSSLGTENKIKILSLISQTSKTIQEVSDV